MRNDVMNKYNFSITKGSLLYDEMNKIIENLDLDEIFNESLNTDYIFLPQNSESSRKTIGSQLIQRILATKWKELWEVYPLCSEKDQKLICFYAVCCKYELMRDFMLELYHDKWLNMKDQLTKEDVYHFLELKSDHRPELNELKEYTKSKIVQVVYRTLNEAGLLQKDNMVDLELSEELKDSMRNKGEDWFLQITNML